jgi:transcriptional regulator with XRE-family HTH domain
MTIRRNRGVLVGKKMMDVLDELVPEGAESGEMLRALRKREGLTLDEMEEITGIHANNLSAIENGRIDMSQHYAEVFASALDVHPMVFLYPNGKFEKTAELRKIEKRAARFRKHG